MRVERSFNRLPLSVTGGTRGDGMWSADGSAAPSIYVMDHLEELTARPSNVMPSGGKPYGVPLADVPGDEHDAHAPRRDLGAKQVLSIALVAANS